MTCLSLLDVTQDQPHGHWSGPASPPSCPELGRWQSPGQWVHASASTSIQPRCPRVRVERQDLAASGHPWEHPCSEADLPSSSSSQHPAEGASITAGCKEGVEALLRVPSHGAGAGPHARCLPHATGTGRAGGHSVAELCDHDGGSQPLHCLWQGQHIPKGPGCWLRQ